mmetsp:Transcript_17431/g.54228  ORF Transcript_17431/g.54228 Transcript_17431/m.54228 type:complete len:331 (-) Transcript_17431:427-1419(-)
MARDAVRSDQETHQDLRALRKPLEGGFRLEHNLPRVDGGALCGGEPHRGGGEHVRLAALAQEAEHLLRGQGAARACPSRHGLPRQAQGLRGARATHCPASQPGPARAPLGRHLQEDGPRAAAGRGLHAQPRHRDECDRSPRSHRGGERHRHAGIRPRDGPGQDAPRVGATQARRGALQGHGHLCAACHGRHPPAPGRPDRQDPGNARVALHRPLRGALHQVGEAAHGHAGDLRRVDLVPEGVALSRAHLRLGGHHASDAHGGPPLRRRGRHVAQSDEGHQRRARRAQGGGDGEAPREVPGGQQVPRPHPEGPQRVPRDQAPGLPALLLPI